MCIPEYFLQNLYLNILAGKSNVESLSMEHIYQVMEADPYYSAVYILWPPYPVEPDFIKSSEDANIQN